MIEEGKNKNDQYLRLHLGCGWRNFGKNWVHIDKGDYEHLDYKSNINKLPMIDDDSVDEIYASHVIAYFNRQEIISVFKEWFRVLKNGAILRLGTPDALVLAKLYSDGTISLDKILGPFFGKMKMGNKIIYHKTVYDFISLQKILKDVGFTNITQYDWRNTDHSNFDDHSQAYIPHMDKENGTLISLNIECICKKD